uniref:Ig-like domain-containing protein n=1 Tax=Timema poppense TaxID=170557 RepID=A0A7R9CGU0_TIMPO|nr:unnamed protein product [Timema poppensis]
MEGARSTVHKTTIAPVCKSEEVNVVGASLDEALRVRCHATADPTDVKFVWQFNNSGESFEVPPSRFGTVNGTSELNYTLTSDRDYGTLACWGTNAIGRQMDPCIFQVVPAGVSETLYNNIISVDIHVNEIIFKLSCVSVSVKPSPLRNCTLRMATNQSVDTLEVECLAGYDGGLPQRFVLEAYESRTMRLRLNVTTSEAPLFRIDLADLLPAHTPTLHLVIYSANPKGRSDVTMLEDITLRDAEKRTESVSGDGGAGMSVIPLAALLTGAVLTLGIAVLFVAVLAVRRRRGHHHRHVPQGTHFAHELDPESVKQKVPPGPPTRQNSMLEINHGDQRYVVSYTLKSATECGDHQPDILNPSRVPDGLLNEAPPQRPEVLFAASRDGLLEANRRQSAVLATYMSPGTLTSPEYPSTPPESPPPLPTARSRLSPPGALGTPSSAYTTVNGSLRKEHNIISNSIPGPESCV